MRISPPCNLLWGGAARKSLVLALAMLGLFLTGTSIAQATYNTTVTGTAGLTNYWRFGEASGATATATTGGINGTYTGPPTQGVAGLISGDV